MKSYYQTHKLLGKVFGKLNVIEKVANKNKKSAWLCKCECGNEKVIIGSSLVKKEGTRSCGCLAKNHFVNLEGQSYNDLTLVRLTGQNNWKCWVYIAKCVCGNKITVEGNDVKSGKIKSCGCLKNRTIAAKSIENPTEPLIKTIYRGYKGKAKLRNHEFAITLKQFKEFIFKDCYYCGSKPLNIKKVKYKLSDDKIVHYNGIDRVDNSVGYLIDNCVTSCYRCNQAKHRMTQIHFYEWVQELYTNLKKKKIV